MDAAVPVPAVSEDEAIGQVLARFHDPELDELPVVAADDDPRFVGTLSRRDILTMLRHEVLVEPSRPVRMARKGGAASYVEMPEGWRIVETGAPPETLGRPLDPTRWAAERGSLPLVVLRSDGAGGRRALSPVSTSLQDGDSVVVLAPE
jgi:hypothetical protein